MYQAWTDKITHVKELDDQVKTNYKPEKGTTKELIKTIKQMKNNKATGPDEIPNEILTNADPKVRDIEECPAHRRQCG